MLCVAIIDAVSYTIQIFSKLLPKDTPLLTYKSKAYYVFLM